MAHGVSFGISQALSGFTSPTQAVDMRAAMAFIKQGEVRIYLSPRERKLGEKCEETLMDKALLEKWTDCDRNEPPAPHFLLEFSGDCKLRWPGSHKLNLHRAAKTEFLDSVRDRIAEGRGTARFLVELEEFEQVPRSSPSGETIIAHRITMIDYME